MIRDLVIIGAGPAGLSAAAAARALDLDPLLLDEQAAAGGQVYRNVTRVAEDRPADLAFLGEDYRAGRQLITAAALVDRRQDATVWHIGPPTKDAGREVIWSEAGQARTVRSRAVLLATGAMERPVPVPGWTLPGVTTVGALQIALKHATCPDGRTVLAGSGPLLMLLASQYAAAGVPLAGILDTTPPGELNRGLPWLLPAALGSAGTLAKGWRLRGAYRAAGPLWRGATQIAAEGDGRLQRVRFTDGTGQSRVLDADVLALHEGVIPNPQLTRLVGAEHVWDERQRCFRPVLDPYGKSSVAGVYVAGDGGGILGAKAAELAGRLAVGAIAHDLGRVAEAERDFRAAADLDRLTGQRWLRRFLDAMYPPPDWLGTLDDAVTVCRCEEVTAGEIRTVAGHAQGPDQLKAYTRCGMGPCQGRMCGPSVTEVLAAAQGRSPGAVGSYHIRSPAKPVTVGELASLAE
jgi:NADPH-dependent 2,4-dienoyl-CoA reductase/sulfur reductase-like enzyme